MIASHIYRYRDGLRAQESNGRRKLLMVLGEQWQMQTPDDFGGECGLAVFHLQTITFFFFFC